MEQELGRLARGAHGVVTRAALLDAGVSHGEIKHRLRTGALLRDYPGVYRVGHSAPTVEASYLAAVRACGEGSVLSGRAAAHLLGLVRGTPPPPDVTAPTQRRLGGIRTRRARLDPADVAIRRGIPLTSVARTVVDLAPDLSADELARACHEAGVRYGITPADVEAALGRVPNRPGAGKLRRVIRGEVRVTLSKLEAQFLARLTDAHLALPETNRPAGGRRVDCRWPERRLTIELDSYRYHQSRHAWENDRRREREAHARGDEFRRYTYGDVVEDPEPMLRELRGLLSPSNPA